MGERGIEDIKKFLDDLKEKFDPELVLLFGSRAKGEHLKESDYDFIVVSKKFEGLHFLDRISHILELWNYDQCVDILPYTPEEFKKKKKEIGIVSEALKEGIVIVKHSLS